MKGTILGYDPAASEGVITSADGQRIKFARSEWKSQGEPSPGRQVDFDVADDRAVGIFVVPGTGSPLNMDGQDPAKQATIFGAISLVCAIVSFFLGPLGIITLVLAVVFGIKGKNIGADLPDKTGFYLAVAGLILSAIALFIVLLALSACVGMVGLLGGLGGFSAFR
jgi:hypothetical protein